MNYLILTNELALPAYSGLTDQEAADSLNNADIERNLDLVTGTALIDAQNSAEYIALSDAKKAQWLALCGLNEIDPFGTVVDIAIDIWGAGSVTLSNLNAIRKETIPRATELGLPFLYSENVRFARTL